MLYHHRRRKHNLEKTNEFKSEWKAIIKTIAKSCVALKICSMESVSTHSQQEPRQILYNRLTST